ncbi:phage tail fiber protein [Lelliottia nimipressuralis]|uniref:phage tail fiber protein n=1 Tax=Lelliottia nimipressuralis TaxID=69220 RepID=UPI00289B77ED|nr:phage tail protein [Lelliottia nimipressuralis]
MLYNTGTIAINGNTATGTGTNWTAPASQVRAGQTIIVLSNPVQMFQISSVNNAASLTVTPAASPALSGQKYGILVSDIISVDGLAQAMSQLIKEYDENIGAWETFATTSANQSITVTINGTPVTIPSIGKLALKGSNGALGVADGGTGATSKEDARTNLGLGSSATRDAYSSSGKMISEGDFGLGGKGVVRTWNDTQVVGYLRSSASVTEFWRNNADTGHTWAGGPCLYTQSFDSFFNICVGQRGQGIKISSGTTDGASLQVYTPYTDKNTTKSSDGTLKAASPVARIVTSPELCKRTDVAEDGFTWCGCGTANAEAEGINLSRLDVGVYMLTGSAGLASEGWQLLPPMDPGGMGELGVVEAEQTDSGGLKIHLFKRKYVIGDEGEIIKTKGEPIDVPVSSWIDVRLDMPDSSIWNKRQAEAGKVKEISDFENQQDAQS